MSLKQLIQIRSGQETVDDLEKLVKATGKSRSELVRDLVSQAKTTLDDLMAQREEINQRREAIEANRQMLNETLGESALKKNVPTGAIHEQLYRLDAEDHELVQAKKLLEFQISDAQFDVVSKRAIAARIKYLELGPQHNAKVREIIQALKNLNELVAEQQTIQRELYTLETTIRASGEQRPALEETFIGIRNFPEQLDNLIDEIASGNILGPHAHILQRHGIPGRYERMIARQKPASGTGA